ncbi:hypothetical protein [Streptomyces sp. NPDC002994]|uniref:hypothetical protein n=1 Tax=Streptomyces sp. NPDC002994 TaxID=3154441 RepID=UPI0033A76E28
MSPMWDEEPERGSGTCAACDQHTNNGTVRWVPRASFPDIRIVTHADPADCRPAAATPTDFRLYRSHMTR